MYCWCNGYYPSWQLIRRNHISHYIVPSVGCLLSVTYCACYCILLFLMYINKKFLERLLWVPSYSYCSALQYRCAKTGCCDRCIVLVSLPPYTSWVRTLKHVGHDRFLWHRFPFISRSVHSVTLDLPFIGSSSTAAVSDPPAHQWQLRCSKRRQKKFTV